MHAATIPIEAQTLIGAGFSTRDDPFEAGRQAALQAHQQASLEGRRRFIRQKPILIIVFSTVHFQSIRLLEGIYSVFKTNTYVLGGTGAGVITHSDTHTGISKYGVAILAIQSTKIDFSTALVREIDKRNPRHSGAEFARLALKNLQEKTREMALIFSDGLTERGSEMLLGIKDVLGRSFPVIGGSCADNLLFEKTSQYFNKEVLHNALTGTILAGEGAFGYCLRHGWRPLGKAHTVTASQGSVIHEIENRPAVEIYETYFKKNRQEIQSLFSQISILYPLGIYLPSEEEYLLRNPIRINALGGLVCQGDTLIGSQVNLMMGTQETALQAVKQATWAAKYALKESPVLAAIVIESVSRSKLLGYRAKEEIEIIKNILGARVPFAGICTFGEQAPLKEFGYHGESHFHNGTVAIITIGERRVAIESEPD